VDDLIVQVWAGIKFFRRVAGYGNCSRADKFEPILRFGKRLYSQDMQKILIKS
jgi:hypothetical protein